MLMQQQTSSGAADKGTGPARERGIGAFASKYQPAPFEGEDDKWKEWCRVFRSWSGRFYDGRMAEIYDHIDAHRKDSANISELELATAGDFEDGLVRVMASELYHVLVMLMRGRAQKLVLKAGEPEGLEAFRLLLKRYEPSTTASAVAKLVEALASTFSGDLVDSVTDFERKVANWEHETGETLSDLIKIGVVVKGLEKGNFRDHLLINTSQTTDWNQFMKEIENVEAARKNTKAIPMDLSAFGENEQYAGNCSWCQAYGHMARDCRKKQQYKAAQEGKGGSTPWAYPAAGSQSSWPGASKGKDKGKEKGSDKGKGKGPDKGKGKGKKGKGGKGAGKKGKKGLHEMEGETPKDDWPTDQWNPPAENYGGETWWHEGAGENDEWRTENWATGAWQNESSSGAALAQERGISMLGGLGICELAQTQTANWGLESLGLEAVDVRSDRSRRTITFGVDTAACRTVVPASHPAARGYRVHSDSEKGAPYATAGKSLVWDEGHRLLVAKQASGGPMTLSTRQAQVRRPLMAVKPMTKQGQWVCFGPDRAFAYRPETGRVIPFEPTPTGWNLTLELEAPNDANRKLEEYMELEAGERREDQWRAANAPGGVPAKVMQLISGAAGSIEQCHPFHCPGSGP